MDPNSIPNQTAAPDSPPEPQRNEPRATAPTRDELTQWETEASRFLGDVERRINGILESLGGGSATPAPAQYTSIDDAFDPDFEPSPAGQPADGGVRISALKAQLARKLNDFDESSDDLFGNLSQPESRP